MQGTWAAGSLECQHSHVTAGCHPGTLSTENREMPIASLGQRAGVFSGWLSNKRTESSARDLLIGTVTESKHYSSSPRLYYFAKVIVGFNISKYEMSPFIDCGLYFHQTCLLNPAENWRETPDLLQTGSQNQSVGQTAAAWLTGVIVSQPRALSLFSQFQLQKETRLVWGFSVGWEHLWVLQLSCWNALSC